MLYRPAFQKNNLHLNFSYSLAPEFPFPTQINGCFEVVRYILKNAQDIGGDSNRIALAGDSVGKADFIFSIEYF